MAVVLDWLRYIVDEMRNRDKDVGWTSRQLEQMLSGQNVTHEEQLVRIRKRKMWTRLMEKNDGVTTSHE